eukprot:224239-Heterocapsa_arctica.AAC.1
MNKPLIPRRQRAGAAISSGMGCSSESPMSPINKSSNSLMWLARKGGQSPKGDESSGRGVEGAGTRSVFPRAPEPNSRAAFSLARCSAHHLARSLKE